MTSTTKRRRRLALMAAGTAAAMVLLPTTAFAQEDPLDEVLTNTTEVAQSVTGPAAPAQAPGDETGINPELGDPVEDDDSDGHETEDPQFPDHGSGEVLKLDLGDGLDLGDEEDGDAEEILDVSEYDATIEDDGSASAGFNVLGLLGDEVSGSEADSEGNTEESENVTEDLCEDTDGLLCLSLLFSDTFAVQDEDGSFAGARGGVLALCLDDDDGDAVTTSECDGLLSLGVAEGVATAQRNNDGNTATDSANELASLCLGESGLDLGDGSDDGSDDGSGDGFCEGLGLVVLHSESSSFATDDDQGTERDSFLLALDSDGDREEIVGDPESLEVLDCGDNGGDGELGEELALLCLFLNQGESFIFTDDEGRNGAASAQEALHLDILPDTILLEIGRAESLARDFDKKDDGDGKKPECSDGVDNDGDGKIDFPKDPECDSPEDDSESNGKGDGNGNGDGKGDGDDGDGGLAFTGSDITPLLAGAFLLIGMGSLTMAATRRRIGKHFA